MSTQDRARALMSRRYQMVKNRQQSILGRTAQELGMSDEISNYWNPVQGKLDVTARMIYGKSHTT
ncbi:hypothetical protein [Calothrix sp. NIES-3974]|uniref:hypothetical protein n=1 Tax=Calothrix sp. NIES-3974 TaxID=2005462 RepID=UPI000B60C6D5|nr:hypothetical protein [Calothrix sp. NIES-3974]BAZ04058.1 hypothetical protein NIES3974_06880 [Calothrix sp. NIES-3974]